MPRDPLQTCRHCGSALPETATDGFCCRGCAAARHLIETSGLGGFYDRLLLSADQRPLIPAPQERPDLGLNIVHQGDGLFALNLMVDGLHCAACVWLIETLLSRQEDIVAARVNFTTRRLGMTWKGAADDAAHLVGLVESLGFRLIPFDPEKLKNAGDATLRALIRALAVAGFAASNVMLLSVSVWAGHGSMGAATRDLLHWISALIALPAILYAGRPFFRSAATALSHGRTNMEVPISIGVVLAAGMSLSETIRHGEYAYFDSAVTLPFFLLIGRVLDHVARGRAREAAAHLLSLGVSGAVRADGTAVAVAALKPGERILSAAGERIAADGRVAQGVSDLDTSVITGESLPRPVGPGDAVFAGQINLTAPLIVEVTAAGESTLLAEIVRLMEAAEGGRARYRLLADRLTRLYAPFVHVAALAAFLYWLIPAGAAWQIALLRAVSVLIVTCPCALGLAVPAVQVAASGRLFKRGILLKSATALERLAEVDLVAFDKTGTLTTGTPKLLPCPTDTLALAASLAKTSRHPLARALATACPEAKPAQGVVEIPGRGLAAQDIRLGSRAWLGLNDTLAEDAELWLDAPGAAPQRFAFAETLRADAVETLSRLRGQGFGLALLSGDRQAAVASVARQCGIEFWRGALDPAGKVSMLTDWAALGRKVLMVGDGLNDGPALAAASVSASPSTAADIAQNAADVVFQGETLAPVAILLRTARKAKRVIRENLAFALAYNLCAVPLAVAGMLTPPLAAALMGSSSLIVVANALRLLKEER